MSSPHTNIQKANTGATVGFQNDNENEQQGWAKGRAGLCLGVRLHSASPIKL